MVEGIGVYGGAERIAHSIAVGLDPVRFDSAFCVTRRIPPREREIGVVDLKEAGVPLIELNRDGRFDFAAWRRLRAYLVDHEIDIIHSHMLGSNVWGALLSGWARTPVFVAHEHTWSFQGRPFRRFLDRELIGRRADAFLAVSEEDRRRMIEVERVPAEKVRVVPNGIPPLAPPNPARDVRAKLGIDQRQPTVGMVAVLRRQKALDVLIEATALLRDEFPDVRVLVAGGEDEAAYTEFLMQTIDRFGLHDAVSLLGDCDYVPDFLEALDVAVLCSDYEGSPLVVMEYMDAAKPVVATRVGGVPDLVEDGVTGLLVDRRSPRALADAIASLLRNPSRAAAMGQAGRERRRTGFSVEAMTRQVEELYEELYSARPSG